MEKTEIIIESECTELRSSHNEEKLEKKDCLSDSLINLSDNSSIEVIDSLSTNPVNSNLLDENGSKIPETEKISIFCNDSTSKSNVDESSNDKDEEWLNIIGSGNFKKKILKPGLGHDTRPTRGDLVTANIIVFVNDEIVDEHDNHQFIVGDLDVIHGIDLVVCLMEKGEKAKVIIPSKLAYGKLGRAPNIPPNCDIECDIEITDIENIDDSKLPLTRRLNFGNEKRTRGNFFYERGDYIDAIRCYERASEYLDGIRDCSGMSDELSQEIVDVRIKVYNNMAASHLKLLAYDSALKSVDNVLQVQPHNIKAIFRKTKILRAKGDTDEAITCIKIAIKLEPKTKVFQSELLKLQSIKKQEMQSQRIMYQRMFPQTVPKESKLSFSNMLKWTAITGGVVALALGLAAYRQVHT